MIATIIRFYYNGGKIRGKKMERLLKNLYKMNMKTIKAKEAEITIYYLKNCKLLVKFDNWNKEVAIINIANKMTIYEDIQKVIKSKEYLILIRDNEICTAISNDGRIGVLVYGNELIRTYASYRKLKSLGKEVRHIYD